MQQAAGVSALNLASLSVPPPTPTALSSAFWAAAAQGRLQLQRCTACRRFAAYPREICPHCWARGGVWEEVSGLGQVQTFTRVHHAGNGGWQAATPYVVALVRLVEGPVLLTQLLAGPETPRAGAACRVAFTRVGEWTLPFFGLVDEPARAAGMEGTS